MMKIVIVLQESRLKSPAHLSLGDFAKSYEGLGKVGMPSKPCLTVGCLARTAAVYATICNAMFSDSSSWV